MRSVPPSIASKLPLAAALIADGGLDQTKVEDLALATGVPKATLYYYFSGKEEILAYLFTAWLGRMHEIALDVLDGPETASERLCRLIEAQLAFMAEDPDVCRALWSELGRVGRMKEIMEAVNVSYYEPVESLLTEGAKDGSLSHVDDPASTAAAIFGVVSICGLARLFSGQDLAAPDVAAQVASLVINGVGARC